MLRRDKRDNWGVHHHNVTNETFQCCGVANETTGCSNVTHETLGRVNVTNEATGWCTWEMRQTECFQQQKRTKTMLQSVATSRTSYTSHLLAPDLVSTLSSPRAHCRQQLIQGRGLFHVHNLRSRKMSLLNDSETNNELNFVLLYSHLLTHCLHKTWHLAFVLVWELLLG